MNNAEENPDPPPKAFRHPNGQTDEQIAAMLAALGRRKNDTEYLKMWDEGVAEYRRMIQEELERELSEESSYLAYPATRCGSPKHA